MKKKFPTWSFKYNINFCSLTKYQVRTQTADNEPYL